MTRSAPSNKWIIVAVILIPLFIASLFIAGIIALIAGVDTSGGNVAVIRINGIILPESSGGLLDSATASSTAITELIEDADNDIGIKAILLEINSPGGSAVASEEIMKSVLDVEKPVVSLIRDSGASGAYWIASASDWIVASPVSITGSIGVTASYLQFSGLFDDFGIGYERLISGEFKDIGSPFKNLSEKERSELQSIIDQMREYFVSSVADNREMEYSQVSDAATGIIYTGSNAKKLNLIDELGGKKEAEEAIKRLTNLTEVEYAAFEKKAGFFDLARGVFSGNSFDVGRGIGSALTQSIRKPGGVFF